MHPAALLSTMSVGGAMARQLSEGVAMAAVPISQAAIAHACLAHDCACDP
jgi:hypothetical protein